MVRNHGRLGLAACLLTSVALVAGCGTSGSEEPAEEEGAAKPAAFDDEGPIGGRLRISNWADYMPESVIEGFEKETGAKVQVANHANNEEIMGKLAAADGSGFDVVFISGPFVEQAQQRGWLAPLNHAKMPNLENVPQEGRDLPYDPGMKHSVPYAWSNTGLCYRKDKLEQVPDSWGAVLDPPAEARGKVTLLGTDRWLMLPALKMLGHSANTQDAAELDEAKELLIQAKKTMLAFDDTTFQEKLASGESFIAVGWDGWCNYGTDTNKNVQFAIPKEGTDLGVDAMVVMESSENKATAQAFIDWALRPENGTAVAESVYYKVANTPAMEAVDPALTKRFPNLGTPPSELAQHETLRDLGGAARDWSRVVSEIKN